MKKMVVWVLLLALALSGCGKQPDSYETEFFAMNTVMQLRLYSAENAADLSRTVIQTVNTLEDILSVTKEKSEVFRLNAGESLAPSDDLQTLLERTLALSTRTEGYLDPTVYPIVSLWGFTTGDNRVPTEQEREAALFHVGTQHIHWNGDTLFLDDGTQLDFGAVAKGYASELCAAQLLSAGATGVLSLGGNVQTIGQRPDGTPWRIGITDPQQPSGSIAILTLTGSHAVVTSGGYQRYFEEDGIRYSHIMNPMTGESVHNGIVSVTVVADSGFLADGLSTALYVMGMEKAVQFWQTSDDFEAIFITEEGDIYVSEGLEEQITCDTEYQVIRK